MERQETIREAAGMTQQEAKHKESGGGFRKVNQVYYTLEKVQSNNYNYDIVCELWMLDVRVHDSARSLQPRGIQT